VQCLGRLWLNPSLDCRSGVCRCTLQGRLWRLRCISRLTMTAFTTGCATRFLLSSDWCVFRGFHCTIELHGLLNNYFRYTNLMDALNSWQLVSELEIALGLVNPLNISRASCSLHWLCACSRLRTACSHLRAACGRLRAACSRLPVARYVRRCLLSALAPTIIVPAGQLELANGVRVVRGTVT
jgi:hypothetical protein